jgi:hypothetical protein
MNSGSDDRRRRGRQPWNRFQGSVSRSRCEPCPIRCLCQVRGALSGAVCGVTPCGLVDSSRWSGEIYCQHHQGRILRLVLLVTNISEVYTDSIFRANVNLVFHQDTRNCLLENRVGRRKWPLLLGSLGMFKPRSAGPVCQPLSSLPRVTVSQRCLILCPLTLTTN